MAASVWISECPVVTSTYTTARETKVETTGLAVWLQGPLGRFGFRQLSSGQRLDPLEPRSSDPLQRGMGECGPDDFSVPSTFERQPRLLAARIASIVVQ